jgi:arylsulfatase A-like enzyme
VPTYHPNCGCFDENTREYCVRETFHHDIVCTNYYSYHGSLIGSDNVIEDDNAFIGDLAENYLRDRSRDKKPFFLYLPFHTVHKEYIGTQEWVSYYQNLGFDLETSNYYAAITGMDEQIGRIRDLVSELNLPDTMIWFTSDNGPARKTPANLSAFRGYKGTLYEGGVRVPTLIEWPKQIRQNTRISNYVASSVDFFPTVAELWNITTSLTLDGYSILPVLLNNNSSRPSGLGFGFDLEDRWNGNEWQLVWINNDWKLIETLTSLCIDYNCIDTLLSMELYNIAQDPRERHDLYSDSPILSQQLHTELHLWFKNVEMSIFQTFDQVSKQAFEQGLNADINGTTPTVLSLLMLILYLFF